MAASSRNILSRYQVHRLFGLGFAAVLLLTCLGLPAWAVPLSQWVNNFPKIQSAQVLESASGALVYPEWFLGTWQVRTTLTDLAAPLGEKIINRQAFAASRSLKGKPVSFRARFIRNSRQEVVADLAFNNRSISEAYFGKENIVRVEAGPEEPNRQVLTLKGNRRGELITLRRRTEQPGTNQFDVAEFYQQTFIGSRVPNLRGIETTTLYRRTRDDRIGADQVTAVFLDPRDPAYFDARNRPVTLYRYRLDFERLSR